MGGIGMNWYKHYIGDYQRDTGHLSMVEHGAYRLMLDTHYATEAPLPKTHSVLFRLLRAFTEAEQEAVVTILSQYWTETPAGYVNDRSGREFEKYANKINAARENGNRGGRPKKTHDVTETKTETITETEPAEKAHQNQKPDNQKEESPHKPPEGGHEPNAPRETNRVKRTFAQAIEASPGLKTGCIAKAKRLFADHGWPEVNWDLLWEEFERYWAGDGARKKKSDWPGTFYNRAMENRLRAAYRIDTGPNDEAARIAAKYAAQAEAERGKPDALGPDLQKIPDFLRRTA